MNAHGKWSITLSTPIGDREGVLELRVDGKSLSGSMSDGEHRVEIAQGSIDGNELEWSAKLTKPIRMTVKFTATVEQDRIDGKARYLLGTAAFHGARLA